MALVNLTGIETQAWTILEDGAALEAGVRTVVPLARLTLEEEAFFAGTGEVGALVPTDADYKTLAPLANKLAFVAIQFPAFGDGRGFSLAVRLRKDLGFKGEIRALGPVIPDQAMHLLRSGFNTVETSDKRAPQFEAAAKRYGVFYQTDFVGQTSLAHARHAKKEERKAS